MPDQPRQPIANIERLKEHMAAEGLGAVVARSGKNFSYLSGVAFPGTLARHLDLPTLLATSSAYGPSKANRQ